jgi:hypothetical protein
LSSSAETLGLAADFAALRVAMGCTLPVGPGGPDSLTLNLS